MTSFRMGLECRRSYKARDRSLAQLARMSGSEGLKRTAIRVSAPHEKVDTGSERAWSQISSCSNSAIRNAVIRPSSISGDGTIVRV